VLPKGNSSRPTVFGDCATRCSSNRSRSVTVLVGLVSPGFCPLIVPMVNLVFRASSNAASDTAYFDSGAPRAISVSFCALPTVTQSYTSLGALNPVSMGFSITSATAPAFLPNWEPDISYVCCPAYPVSPAIIISDGVLGAATR
jgi:hypothetical protein